MEGFEADARRDGGSLLVLDTREGDAANELYRVHGYREVGRIPRYARAVSGRLEATISYI
jgi:acetyltransferase